MLFHGRPLRQRGKQALALVVPLGDIPRVVPSEQRKPWWLYPNLLSLDAPLVAVVWLYIFAKTWRVEYLPWVAYVALALIVWMIYVADRLLDASMLSGPGESSRIEARHEFHQRHKGKFAIGARVAAIVSLILVTAPLKIPLFGFVFRTGLPFSIYTYALVGGLLVTGFFALSLFSSHGPDEIPYAKNVIAGVAFAYGTAIVAHVYTGFDLHDLYTLQLAELGCFAVLCILNISAIDLWEHASRQPDEDGKASDELALTLPLIVLGGASLLFALKDGDVMTRPFFYAILTGAALLYIVNRTRARFRPDSLRVLADVALIVPLLVFNVFQASMRP